MEPAAAGFLYAAQDVLSGAAALVKGITHPTQPIKAKLTRITSVLLPRSQHTISIVKGRAYIFGGEMAPGQLADNNMHIVILPSSGVVDADYTSKPPQAANGIDDVPGPRRGHTAVVIGDSIYIFGGHAGNGTVDEKGRIWVYHTVSNAWSFLDPAFGTTAPSHRVGHTSASSDLPAAKTVTYQERAPQQPADPSTHVPEPAVDDTWGTIFIVGGRTLSGELVTDALAFDLKTRAWSIIPSPPGQPLEGASLSLAGSRLYRFGGKGVETFASRALEYLDVAPVFRHAEGGTYPLTSGWAWQEVLQVDSKGVSAPQARSYAGLVEMTTGQGRHYLLAVGGEGENAKFLNDIWAFQLAPEDATAAATKDAIRASMKRNTHEATWAEALYQHVDFTGEEEMEVPGEPKRGLGDRGHFGLAKGTEVDGATCVVWGGIDSQDNVLGDGWMITVDR